MIYLVGDRKASIPQGYVLCTNNRCSYLELNYRIWTLYKYILFYMRLVVYMLELDNYTTKQEPKKHNNNLPHGKST